MTICFIGIINFTLIIYKTKDHEHNYENLHDNMVHIISYC